MNGIRKSSRLRKPITSLDQNLENEDDAFIPTKKRQSTDDHDQIESPAPARKRANRKKTSPYFQKEKSAVKKRKKSDENRKVVKKPPIESENEAKSSSDSDDEGGWNVVQSNPNEMEIIQKMIEDRDQPLAPAAGDEVAVKFTQEEMADAQRKGKKKLNSHEHQLELQLKRVLRKNFLRRHKRHIVFNLAHGFDLVKRLINNRELRSLLFSLLDESMTKSLRYNSKTTNINDVHRLLKYFNEIFLGLEQKSTDDESPMTFEKIRHAISESTIELTSPIRVVLFAIFARLLDYECRLIFAADLPAIRPRTSQPTLNKKINRNQDDSSSAKPTSLNKNNQAISPNPTEKSQRRRLAPRFYWVELFLERSDDGYIPIDLSTSSINNLTEFEENISFSMLYVWAFDTEISTFYVKDVTKIYSTKWLTSLYRTSHIEHKTNGDPKWYKSLMMNYQPTDKRKSRHSAIENKKIQDQLSTQPIPQSKSELIGHPLYVLRSKLLKFEGIYPNDTQPLGWLKEDPIYSRENIHILRSKQTWLKEARQVNIGEEPYKIVDGRIKNSARKMGITTRPELELFGEWQTSTYVPPIAKDGIVPCNEYGNVDLFQPEMIPVGCVHVVEPQAARLCKKLGINYAEAITGFDAHGGGSHPVIEGIVICQEFEQTLREAIEQQKQISIEKEVKKKEERIYKNWRKLIRGVVIRENLAKKYADKPCSNNETQPAVSTMDDDDDEYL